MACLVTLRSPVSQGHRVLLIFFSLRLRWVSRKVSVREDSSERLDKPWDLLYALKCPWGKLSAIERGMSSAVQTCQSGELAFWKSWKISRFFWKMILRALSLVRNCACACTFAHALILLRMHSLFCACTRVCNRMRSCALTCSCACPYEISRELAWSAYE